MPWLHTSSDAHAWPQRPQLSWSLVSSWQASVQNVSAGGHAHEPENAVLSGAARPTALSAVVRIALGIGASVRARGQRTAACALARDTRLAGAACHTARAAIFGVARHVRAMVRASGRAARACALAGDADFAAAARIAATAAIRRVGRRIDAAVSACRERRRTRRRAHALLAERRRPRTRGRAAAAVHRIGADIRARAPAEHRARRTAALAIRTHFASGADGPAASTVLRVVRRVDTGIAARCQARGARRLADPVHTRKARPAGVTAGAAARGAR